MRKIVVAALLGLFLTACSKGVVDESRKDATEGFPSGTKALVAPGNRWTWVVPVEVKGTPCIVTMSNGSGNAISCDWK